MTNRWIKKLLGNVIANDSDVYLWFAYLTAAAIIPICVIYISFKYFIL